MKNKSIQTLMLMCLSSFIACSQNTTSPESSSTEKSAVKETIIKQEPHSYGGWYCPDNLKNFPAIDITNWESVPVVNGRLPNKEEAQNGTSLIFVDKEKYPNAKPLDMTMPRLARFYNHSSQKNELIIVIQAIKIQEDSIVGFRYLNGGNGSARIKEVSFLDKEEIDKIPSSHFVSFSVEIDASQKEIWEILTNKKYKESLQSIFDSENKLAADWRESSELNFKYANSGEITSAWAGEMYGNYYAQIDCQKDDYQYVEKFLLTDYELSNLTGLHIVCGPYYEDFETQKVILKKWAKKVKELSEKN
jgi:hypothetical protein